MLRNPLKNRVDATLVVYQRTRRDTDVRKRTLFWGTDTAKLMSTYKNR